MTHTQKTAICTREISHFEASGVTIWFNKEDTDSRLSLRNAPSFLTTQKMAVATRISAAGLDLLHLGIIPPPGGSPKQRLSSPSREKCKVGTIFRLTSTCSLPFHSCPHEHGSFPEPRDAMSMQIERTSRGSSCLQEIHKRDNALFSVI